MPKAAKDWPQINFIIYHAALRASRRTRQTTWPEFERTGNIRWASDLAAIPYKYGVNNVFAELGTCFAVSAVTQPTVLRRDDGHADQGPGPRPCLLGD